MPSKMNFVRSNRTVGSCAIRILDYSGDKIPPLASATDLLIWNQLRNFMDLQYAAS